MERRLTAPRRPLATSRCLTDRGGYGRRPAAPRAGRTGSSPSRAASHCRDCAGRKTPRLDGHQTVRRRTTCHTRPRFGLLNHRRVKGSRPCKASSRSIRSLPRSGPATKCTTGRKTVISCASKRKADGHSRGSIASDEGSGSRRLIEGREPEVLPWSRRCSARDHTTLSVVPVRRAA